MTLVNGVYHFSNSEITTFQACPRKWWLAWYRGLTPKHQTVQSAMSTGSRLHVALAALYTPGLSAVTAAAIAIVTLHEAQEDALATMQMQSLNDEDFDHREGKLKADFELERIMLDGYLEWIAETGIDADLEVIATETYLEAELTNVARIRTILIGKLDARVRSRITGTRKFIDHKTVTTFKQPTLRMNRQMLHYHLLEYLNTGFNSEERCDGALYNMLRKVKRGPRAVPPFYQRTPIPHNKYEIYSYLDQVIGLMRDIIGRATAFDQISPSTQLSTHQDIVPARPSMECTWCPFLKICTMFDDGSRVEAAIEDNYQVQDPLSYYGALEKGAEIGN